MLELLFSGRKWPRGDRVNLRELMGKEQESTLNKDTTIFIFEKCS
jgi:hypothetical protein